MSFTLSILPRAGLCLALLAAGTVFVPAASAQNLLSNSGFESGSLSPWRDYTFSNGGVRDTVDWHVTTDSVHSGQFAATCMGPRALEQRFSAIAVQNITEFSFWARGDFDVYGIYLDTEAGPNDPSSTQYIHVGGEQNFGVLGEYKFFNYTEAVKFDAPSNNGDGIKSNLVGFSIGYGYNPLSPLDPTTTYLDDLTLTAKAAAVPEASTTASLGFLLVLGGLGVAVRRRRAVG